ncbi:helix-turn-helix domain-containing protein [Kribbella sp. NPDC056951]|uniref:helix-turn-helix domain-containing protein n=1 Tax=Kribbella sp. NPDC056951 TaxID=3345978 RepID=UPI0036374433
MTVERAALLAGATVWTRTAAGGDYLILPDGCMDLLLMDDDLVVAGPDSVAWTGTAKPGTRYAGLRFAPGDAPAFLGVPAHALLNERVPLSELWSRSRSRKLADRVRGAADPAVELDLAVAELMETPGDPLARQVFQHVRADTLRAGRGVVGLARKLEISERQLHRRCLGAFGYGAKMLDRVLRMNAALDRARTGQALAEVAAVSGYADQAHLTRDVKALTGLPPSTLLR